MTVSIPITAKKMAITIHIINMRALLMDHNSTLSSSVPILALSAATFATVRGRVSDAILVSVRGGVVSIPSYYYHDH